MCLVHASERQLVKLGNVLGSFHELYEKFIDKKWNLQNPEQNFDHILRGNIMSLFDTLHIFSLTKKKNNKKIYFKVLFNPW